MARTLNPWSASVFALSAMGVIAAGEARAQVNGMPPVGGPGLTVVGGTPGPAITPFDPTNLSGSLVRTCPVEQPTCAPTEGAPTGGGDGGLNLVDGVVIGATAVTVAADSEITYHPASASAADWRGITGGGDNRPRVDVTAESITGDSLTMSQGGFSLGLLADADQPNVLAIDARFGDDIGPRLARAALGAGATYLAVQSGGTLSPWLAGAAGGYIGFNADRTVSHAAWWLLGNGIDELERVEAAPGTRVSLRPGQMVEVTLPNGERGYIGITPADRAEAAVAFFVAETDNGLNQLRISPREGDNPITIGSGDGHAEGRYFQAPGLRSVFLADRSDPAQRLDFTMPHTVDVEIGDCNLCQPENGIPFAVTLPSGETARFRANIEYRRSAETTDGAGDIFITSYQPLDAEGAASGAVIDRSALATQLGYAVFDQVDRALDRRIEAFDGVQDNLALLEGATINASGLIEITTGLDSGAAAVNTGTPTDGYVTVNTAAGAPLRLEGVGGTSYLISARYTNNEAVRVAAGEFPPYIMLTTEVDDSAATLIFARNASGDYVTTNGQKLEDVLGGECTETALEELLKAGEPQPPATRSVRRVETAPAPPVAPVTFENATQVEGSDCWIALELSNGTRYVRLTPDRVVNGTQTFEWAVYTGSGTPSNDTANADVRVLETGVNGVVHPDVLAREFGLTGRARTAEARELRDAAVEARMKGIDCDTITGCDAEAAATAVTQQTQNRVALVTRLAGEDGRVGVTAQGQLVSADDPRAVYRLESSAILAATNGGADVGGQALTPPAFLGMGGGEGVAFILEEAPASEVPAAEAIATGGSPAEQLWQAVNEPHDKRTGAGLALGGLAAALFGFGIGIGTNYRSRNKTIPGRAAGNQRLAKEDAVESTLATTGGVAFGAGMAFAVTGIATGLTGGLLIPVLAGLAGAIGGGQLASRLNKSQSQYQKQLRQEAETAFQEIGKAFSGGRLNRTVFANALYTHGDVLVQFGDANPKSLASAPAQQIILEYASFGGDTGRSGFAKAEADLNGLNGKDAAEAFEAIFRRVDRRLGLGMTRPTKKVKVAPTATTHP